VADNHLESESEHVKLVRAPCILPKDTMDQETKRQIEAVQVKDVYTSSIFATFVVFLVASILSLYLWHYIPHSRILGWYLANVLFLLLHYILVHRFRNTDPGAIDYSKWRRIISVSFTLRGIAFGSGGILLFSHSANPQSALIIVLAGMVAGAVGSYHMIKHVVIMFIFTFMVPLSYSFFACKLGDHAIQGVFCLIFMASMVVIALKLNKTYTENMVLRLKREAIAGKLKAETDEKDKLIKNLDMLYRAIEATQAGITICDNERNIIYVNEADARMHGYSVIELLGQKTAVYSSKGTKEQKKLRDLSLLEKGWVRESVNISRDGAELPVLLSSVHIKDKEGQPNAMVTVCEDITKLKENEAQLRTALEQKEMLIKEVHHRVKNNLAVIQSLLNLQSSRTSDLMAKGFLDESQSRVMAMSMIHERLYKSSDLSTLDFADYMSSLVNQLYENYCTNKEAITITIDILPISIDVDTIIPCGLITNELVTNIFKYAFPQGRKGDVFVGVECDEMNRMSLVIRDNGVGLPEGFNIHSSDSFGMKIVNSLSRQIGADLRIRSDEGGTEFRLLLLKPHLMPLEWSALHYMFGHEIIDKQHKQLYKAIESLKDSIESGRQEEGIKEIIPALRHYIDEHFKTEEDIMTRYAYPEYDLHASIHRDFERNISKAVSEIQDGRKGLSLSVYAFLADWLLNHLGDADAKLGAFMKHKGLTSTVDLPDEHP